MQFTDRTEAGSMLADRLKKYKGEKVVVFALPRGGVVTASKIAQELHVPLDLILAHKIGHPSQPEYAIAAISEDGHVMENSSEVAQVDQTWYEQAKAREMEEIRRKRREYVKGRKEIIVRDAIAVLVDDGIATGLTMKAAILELRHKNPKKLVVAVPVAPHSTAQALKSMVDEFIGLIVPSDGSFLGAIGAYYRDFTQIQDGEVISLLEENEKLVYDK